MSDLILLMCSWAGRQRKRTSPENSKSTKSFTVLNDALESFVSSFRCLPITSELLITQPLLGEIVLFICVDSLILQGNQGESVSAESSPKLAFECTNFGRAVGTRPQTLLVRRKLLR